MVPTKVQQLMQISCYTTFDITRTRVVGHFKPAAIPFKDYAGQLVDSKLTWEHSRNQQRNWETLTQVISLRTQLLDITDPELVDYTKWPDQRVWTFTFNIEFDQVFELEKNKIGLLLQDINQVPMLLNLTETANTQPWLMTKKTPNIAFNILN